MANVDSSNFIINSDFPMPAQTSIGKAIVHVPAGTPTSPTSHLYTVLNIGDGQMTRVSIKSSRDNIICPSLGQGLDQFQADANFSAYARGIGNGQVQCEVYVRKNSGSQAPTETQSDNDFTFYVAGFKIP